MNSYRRFQPGMYVPTQASWGHNNRTVALRIPCGDRHNHRVEYRVAGADANPYLVMAAIFAGILHGLDTGWNRKAYPSRFARAMPWVSLSRMITCAAI